MPVTSLTTEAKNAAAAAALLTQEVYDQLTKLKIEQKVGPDQLVPMAATLAAAIIQGNLDQPGQISVHQIAR